MFEPLQDLFHHHAERLHTQFEDIAARLGRLIENTDSELWNERFVTRKGLGETGETTTADVKLEAAAGSAWRVFNVTVTSGEEGLCAVYVGAIEPGNLVDIFNPAQIAVHTTARYYVPRGASLIFHFYEQPKKQVCTVNVQAEQLLMDPDEGSTGTSGEHIQRARREPVPSGSPLDTPTVP